MNRTTTAGRTPYSVRGSSIDRPTGPSDHSNAVLTIGATGVTRRTVARPWPAGYRQELACALRGAPRPPARRRVPDHREHRRRRGRGPGGVAAAGRHGRPARGAGPEGMVDDGGRAALPGPAAVGRGAPGTARRAVAPGAGRHDPGRHRTAGGHGPGRGRADGRDGRAGPARSGPAGRVRAARGARPALRRDRRRPRLLGRRRASARRPGPPGTRRRAVRRAVPDGSRRRRCGRFADALAGGDAGRARRGAAPGRRDDQRRRRERPGGAAPRRRRRTRCPGCWSDCWRATGRRFLDGPPVLVNGEPGWLVPAAGGSPPR